jgi:hypothetical protein
MHSERLAQSEAKASRQRTFRIDGDLRSVVGICLLLTIALVGCVAAGSHDENRNSGFSGKELEVCDGGAFSEQRTYRLSGDNFEFEFKEPRKVGSGEYHFEISRHGSRKLEIAEANAIWAEIGKLRIESWKARYSPRDVGTDVQDGPEWSLKLHVDGKTTTSIGVSAFPAVSQPKQTVIIYGGPNAYDALIAILRPLEDRAK